MKRCLIIVLFAIGSVSSCHTTKQTTEIPKSDGKKSYEEFEATIKAFPYEAPQPRKDRIIKNSGKLEAGMSKEQVADLIGEPDFSRLVYGPKGNMKWRGSSWKYYLYKRENLANNSDPCLHISFGKDDRAKWIVPTNIEGLTEKGDPSH